MTETVQLLKAFADNHSDYQTSKCWTGFSSKGCSRDYFIETLTCITIFPITTCRAGCLFELSGLTWQIRYVCTAVCPLKGGSVCVNFRLPPLRCLSLLAFGARWSKTTVTQLQLQLWFQESLFQSGWSDLTLLFSNNW